MATSPSEILYPVKAAYLLSELSTFKMSTLRKHPTNGKGKENKQRPFKLNPNDGQFVVGKKKKIHRKGIVCCGKMSEI